MDAFTVDLIPLGDVSALLPGRPTLATIRSWIRVGVRGVKLEAVRVGGRIYTTRRAVAEFSREINAPGAVGEMAIAGEVARA